MTKLFILLGLLWVHAPGLVHGGVFSGLLSSHHDAANEKKAAEVLPNGTFSASDPTTTAGLGNSNDATTTTTKHDEAKAILDDGGFRDDEAAEDPSMANEVLEVPNQGDIVGEEAISVADAVQNQSYPAIEIDNPSTNLRHRRLSSSVWGNVKLFHGNHCLQRNTATNNIEVAACTAASNQNMAISGEYFFVDGLCVSDAGGHYSHNLGVQTCINWQHQKFLMDKYGRIQSLWDPAYCVTVDLASNNAYMSWCCLDCTNQHFHVASGTPMVSSQIKVFNTNVCWKSVTGNNIIGESCTSGGNQQNYYWNRQTEQILNAVGAGCVAAWTDTKNVGHWPCDSGTNQKWYWDDAGRIRSRWNSAYCIHMDTTVSPWNLKVAPCLDNPTTTGQAFIVPEAFDWFHSPAKSVTNLNSCWEFHPSTSNLVLSNCDATSKNQQFYYYPPLQRIYAASGGCMALWTDTLNIAKWVCEGGDNLRWYMDEYGRVRNGYHGLCVVSDSNGNIKGASCSETDSEQFSWPKSFPLPASAIKPFYDGGLCWGTAAAHGRMKLLECSSSNQDVFYVPETERIVHQPSGLCVDDIGDPGRPVYLRACHNMNGQKFFLDARGRLHSRRDGKCMDLTNNYLFVKDCNDGDTQRFQYPLSFRAAPSPITTYADQTQCWTLGGTNIHLSTCVKGSNTQDFLYISGTEKIMSAHVSGCLTDEASGGRNVHFATCTAANNQKWYLDAQGRLHSRHDEATCLDVDTGNNSNLHMATCSDSSLSQLFIYPNSFPVVTTNARTAHDRRQELNGYYGTSDQHVYGEETRSVLRYNHPDQVRRNLCPYWESTSVFKYKMQNYAITTESVIEIKSTSDMDELLVDDSRVTVSGLTKRLVIKRPKLQAGYFRLGDYASNSNTGPHTALLVKGIDGTVLKPPSDFISVWDGTSGDAATPTSAGSLWQPVAPPGYTCLGHVWQVGATKPSPDLVRCIQNRFIETAPSTKLFDNNDVASSAEVDMGVWEAGSTSTSLTSGTFLSKASHSPPDVAEFKALKKGCILGHGTFPFCDANDSLNLAATSIQEFSLPFAKLQPCFYEDEDHVGYGLVNGASSKWESYAIELYKNSNGAVGYKHVGASADLGEPYCLGSVVFGSSSIKNDLFIHNVTNVGVVTMQESQAQKNGNIGDQLSTLISGDFVFLFPCSGVNEVKDYKAVLEAAVAAANTDGGSENAVANTGEDLGEMILFGGPKWTNPHYCAISEEPTESGGCREVDFCFFEPGGCKPYDQLACSANADCKGGFCNADGRCGSKLRLYANTIHSNSMQILPRAPSYGNGQDGPGRFLVKENGNKIVLIGNTWKAFPIATHTISYNTVLEFDFMVQGEVEGHAICLDEDLNEDVEIPGAKRCFRLAGTQDNIWTEVWKVARPASTGVFKHYKIKVGSLTGGAPNNEPYIPWGSKISYVAVLQDNDVDRNIGESSFKNLQLYDDSTIPVETVDPGPVITGDSITIDVANPSNYLSWKKTCTRLDGRVPDQPPQSVFRHNGKTVAAPASQTSFTHTLDRLLAGYEYTTRIFPVDGSGNQLHGSTVQETVAATHCCCNCDNLIIGDTTGRPTDLKAYQVKGIIMFNFTDNSQCADAYAFTRTALEDEFFDNSDGTRKSVFTPNYNYFPKTKCGGAPVLPGKSAADDLWTSQLVVGAAYRYCVRAVADFYSADSLHSSDEHCNIHYIRWQASMSGKITTKPMSGGLPIEDVSVSWELLNQAQTVVIASGSAVTKRPGTFSIEFDELHSELNRDNEFPVRIKYSKTTTVGTDTIQHQFLCNDGATDCTHDGNIVYLKHLTFDQPVVSYDNSSVPVRGKVTIWESNGCPLIGAEVCLQDKHTLSPDTLGACVKTDHNGEYNVPAALGSTVGIQVSYNNHTIVKAPENVLDYDTGIFIEANKRYVRNNFVDIAKATLVVEVAGGLCDKHLGTTELQATINGCDASHWKMDLNPQQFFKANHFVPAHVLDLKVTNMYDEDGNDFTKILLHFSQREMTKTIDLVEAGGMQDQTDGEMNNAPTTNGEKALASESEESYDKVRFQWDGDLQMNFFFMGTDVAGDCSVPPGATSFHVTPTGSTFKPKVYLKYELLQGKFCDVVGDDISVKVINKVGIDTDFDTYAAKLVHNTNLLDKLKLCSDDSGCNFGLQHDVISGKKTNAHMIPTDSGGRLLSFAVGRPNLYGSHRKELTVKVLDKNLLPLLTHKAEVLVTGDYVHGPGASFALPTYKPILVLRDPPGGLSQATYDNVQTTIKVKSTSVERVADTAFNFAVALGAEGEIDMCAGLGIMGCDDTVEWDIAAGVGRDQEGTTVLQDNEDSYTSEFTTTWSYATSDDPVLAGRQSDVIVIPNLNVQYHDVETVSFATSPTCNVSTSRVVKFDLKDPGNKPALSFLSVYNIEKHQLPELKQAVSDKQTEFNGMTASHANYTKTKEELNFLNDALLGWTRTMTDYNHTNDQASKNQLAIAGREWFTKWAAVNDMMAHEPTIAEHWANLAPESLTKRATPLDLGFVTSNGLASSDKESLKSTNRIHFSGGGGTMEFLVDHAASKELMRLDPHNANRADSTTTTFGASMDLEAGIQINLDMGGGFSIESSTSGTITDESGDQTSVSFVLGDEQKDDEFVLDVYVDPTYGTFVFHTIGGRSRAPHEPNTKKGEDLSMSMTTSGRPVMPDEAIVFDVTLLNAGETLAVFQAYVDHTTNPGGLRHYMGGVGLEVPIDYTIGAEGTVTTKLEIRRGPTGYVYPSTTMYLVSLWDELGIEAGAVELFNYDDGNGNKYIKFEEPCPRVEWAGSLKRDKKASVIKTVDPVQLSVFNPRSADGTFESLAQNGRLNHVMTWYREIDSGEAGWKQVQHQDANKTQIDFANIPNTPAWKETDYGYATIPWDIGNILPGSGDGTYEVVLESVCDPLPGAPTDFNKFQTEPILLVVDRVEPKLYGKALPVREVIIPGEEIVLVFTEAIQCDLPFKFDLNVSVAGLNPPLFTKDELMIDCEGRKLGFQFDPTRTGGSGWDALMGKDITVTVDFVKDLEGNSLPSTIVFNKKFANLNLQAVTTAFDFRLNTASCTTPIDEANVKNMIAQQLALTDSGRVTVVSSSCDGTTTVAQVTIGPSGRRRLRNEEGEGQNALSAFYSLLDVSSDNKNNNNNNNEPGPVRRKLMSLDGQDYSSFSLGNLKLTPSDEDQKEYGLDANPTPEEEMILAAAEGCDSHHLEQRQQLLQLEESVKKHLNATESQLEKRAKETGLQIGEVNAHIQEVESQVETHFQEVDSTLKTLDHKLEEIASRLMIETQQKSSEDAVVGTQEQSASPDKTTTSSTTEESAQLAQLLAEMRHEQQEMRHEQQETRQWNLVLGFCLFVSTVVIAFMKAGR